MVDQRSLGIVLVGLVAFTGLVGCTDQPVATPPVSRGMQGTPATEGSGMSAGAVRTDREPIARRFPRLGDFSEVHWLGSTIGGSGVPGPSDVLIQGLVVLRPEDLAAARAGYRWEEAPAGWDAKLADALRPLAPPAGDWRYNGQFESEVCTARYSGDVYLDLASGTVYLNVNSR
ncbi:hypothetical protein [Micromonospora sp. HM5-17]|uniref:hypothetical protein n=1 Tax=Micromonospora sp. HM5-17 TaxID=2487710 RepID=UPI001F1F833E|nr:hypothetical protein [Micromonospora sp. HM5-17]